MTKVLIADDHAIVREGLSSVLALAPDIEVVAIASDGWEAIKLTRMLSPDLILTDLSMPGPDGPELIKRLHAEFPRTPVIVLSMHCESQFAARAVKAGAAGYLTKGCEPDILLAAIRRCAAGGHYIEAEIASQLVFSSVTDDANAPPPHSRLSERELEIMLLLAHGHGITDIAHKLCISDKTVGTHKLRLMRKLGAGSLVELVRYAIRAGLIEA